MVRIITAILLIFTSLGSYAQGADSVQVAPKLKTEEVIVQDDSAKVKKPHSPRLATIMSAVVPGAGQVYNKKWWKLPIIYGGFAGLGYAYAFNQQEYKTYKNAYLIRVDDDSTNVDQFDGIYTDANLLELQEFYRRNRDLAIVGAFVLYALNIIDANVDAHLFDFDVSEDLSMKVEPRTMGLGFNSKPIIGVGISLRLK